MCAQHKAQAFPPWRFEEQLFDSILLLQSVHVSQRRDLSKDLRASHSQRCFQVDQALVEMIFRRTETFAGIGLFASELIFYRNDSKRDLGPAYP